MLPKFLPERICEFIRCMFSLNVSSKKTNVTDPFILKLHNVTAFRVLL